MPGKKLTTSDDVQVGQVVTQPREGVTPNPVKAVAPDVKPIRKKKGQKRAVKGPPSLAVQREARERHYAENAANISPEMQLLIEELTDEDTGIGPKYITKVKYFLDDEGNEFRYPEGHEREGLRRIRKYVVIA